MRKVAPHSAQQDDEHDGGEKCHHHDGVEDGEAVHLRTAHLEVCVPARRPLDGALYEGDLVGEGRRPVAVYPAVYGEW